MLREGRILEGGEANQLFLKYSTSSMETIFLRLCAQVLSIHPSPLVSGTYSLFILLLPTYSAIQYSTLFVLSYSDALYSQSSGNSSNCVLGYSVQFPSSEALMNSEFFYLLCSGFWTFQIFCFEKFSIVHILIKYWEFFIRCTQVLSTVVLIFLFSSVD
jgi:hypothetical protein